MPISLRTHLQGSLALGRWLLKQSAVDEDLFHGKMCLEIGAGSTGVPGLVVARYCGANRVVISDTLPRLLKSLERNIALSRLDQGKGADGCDVSVQRLDWDDAAASPEDLPKGLALGSVDVIIGAEVIWAGCDPVPLVQTIRDLLRPTQKTEEKAAGDGKFSSRGGVAFILMPKGGRGGEAPLLEAAATVGLAVETLVLPWALGDEAPCEATTQLAEGSSEECWHLHVFRPPL